MLRKNPSWSLCIRDVLRPLYTNFQISEAALSADLKISFIRSCITIMYNERMQRDAINTKTAAFLLTPRADKMLASLSSAELRPDRLLQTLTQLRSRMTAGEAGAIVSLAQLRARAADKFPQAGQLYFISEALEQATAWPIALRRAAWMDRHLPPGPLLDLGCGVGGDLLALAQFRPVIAYEIDPVRACFARANAKAIGVADRVEVREEDWVSAMESGRLPDAAGAFADPARRKQGTRVFSLHEMEPPLDRLLALQRQLPALGVKVMPGVADDEIPARCSIEFTGHAGTCKEAVLWFGPLAKEKRWASVEVGGTWHEMIADPGKEAPVGLLHPGDTVHEPHSAVIRAGAFAELCELLEAHLIEPQIAYLASPVAHSHPLVQSFRVLEVHPFSLKLANQRIRALGIGQLELKKRGFPMPPEQLRSRLKLQKQGRSAVLLILRRDAGHAMIFAERG
jgi:hypothetical protein